MAVLYIGLKLIHHDALKFFFRKEENFIYGQNLTCRCI
jgi:hypothetical protein